MEAKYSIRSRFGRNSGVVDAIIDRLSLFGISVSKKDVYFSLSVTANRTAKRSRHQDAIRAAYEYYDKHWEDIKKGELETIAG